jgi:hypothetical protein
MVCGCKNFEIDVFEYSAIKGTFAGGGGERGGRFLGPTKVLKNRESEM